MAFPACNSIYVDPKTLPRGIAFVETSAPNNAQNPPSGLQIPQYTGREYDAAEALIYLTRFGAKQVSADALNVRTAQTPKPVAPKRTFLVVEPSDRVTRSMTRTEVPAGQTATADTVKNHRSTQSRGEAHLTTAAHRGEGPCTAEIPCGQESLQRRDHALHSASKRSRVARPERVGAKEAKAKTTLPDTLDTYVSMP